MRIPLKLHEIPLWLFEFYQCHLNQQHISQLQYLGNSISSMACKKRKVQKSTPGKNYEVGCLEWHTIYCMPNRSSRKKTIKIYMIIGETKTAFSVYVASIAWYLEIKLRSLITIELKFHPKPILSGIF